MDNEEKKQLGYKGEHLAKTYLEEKGFVFLAQNYCMKGGEIDLIMKENNTLVFVEVKTKKTNFLSEYIDCMYERITAAKIKFLQRSIETYCIKNGYAIYDTPMRIDIVYVLFKNNEEYRIEHQKDGVLFDD